MIARKYIQELVILSEFSPVIGIIGPRQVGKTTLAKAYASGLDKAHLYLDLERPSDMKKLVEPELFLKEHEDQCIIIDEIQLMPELFSIMRPLVDEKRVPLRFIILGSASPDIIRGASESLAGRIAYIEMKPFSLSELKGFDLRAHHFRGGFPSSILAKNATRSSNWLDQFIRTYIERDLPMLGIASRPQMTRRLWTMLAWQNGQLLNNSAISKSLGVSNHTVNSYIDFLEGAFLVQRIPTFSYNLKKRIVKAPKVYLTDTGVLHQLLGLQDYDALFGSPMLGASWESYVLNQILAEKNNQLDVYYYRTHAGTEIDIVLAKSLTPIASIEVKFSGTPKMTKSFSIGIEDLKTSKNFIIIPLAEDYPIREDVRVVGVREFLTKYLTAL